MSQLTATVEQAARWAAGSSASPATWNPVYRALAGDPPRARQSSAGSGPAQSDLDLVLRQLTAPALLVVAVTEDHSTRRLRIGLDPATATIEHSDGDAPSRWDELPVPELPSAITELLAGTGPAAASPRMTIEREADGLRLTPAQNQAARAALARGSNPEEAFDAIPDLDEHLRDALTASGPRIALSLTLHDPRGRVTERPVSWSRLWVRGERGLYRWDSPSTPNGAVHAVGEGDVLGSVLPILEEGLRFAAAASAPRSAR